MNLCVIPARGGSKRIPRKNVRTFAGRPIIEWSIEAARLSGCFKRIIVSTEDSEIAQISRDCGAEVPFFRSKGLADDYTSTMAVVVDTLQREMIDAGTIKNVCCLYATAPLIEAADLSGGLNVLLDNDCNYAVAVTEYPHPIQRALMVDEKGYIGMINPTMASVRSQDLTRTFHDAGQFYWGRTEAWLSEAPVFSGKTVPLVLPKYRVCDIDTEEDFYRAELIYRALKGK
jgi:pseudaminic acid cytidylyltransferase